jgi:hypothetical protein
MTHQLKLENQRLTRLVPCDRNARTHSKRQIRQVAGSIEQFGFVNPILIDEDARIIAGHARLEAAKLLGLEAVPVICLTHLTEHQKRALAIADNKLPENAGWDEELLAQELKILSEVEVDFDLTITGFSQAEIDLRIESLAPANDPKADEIPEPEPEEKIVVRHGNLFLLSSHRLLCGDATSSDDFEALMSGERAQMVLTDPPYNLPIEGHVSGLGQIKHDDFVMAAGEMSAEQFATFLKQAFANLAAHSADGSIHFVFMDWRHLRQVLAAGDNAYTEFKQLCVWAKSNAGMGSFYRSQHELVLVFKNGRAPHINNFGLGEEGRHRSNVWSYPGVNALGADGSMSSRCTRRSSRSPCLPTRSWTAPTVAVLSSILSSAAARPSSPPRKPGAGPMQWTSIPSTSRQRYAAGNAIPARKLFSLRLARPSKT